MDLLPEGFEELVLAPHAPLGTSSVLGGFSQDRVVTTIADSGVVSDSTNVLALDARTGDARPLPVPVVLKRPAREDRVAGAVRFASRCELCVRPRRAREVLCRNVDALTGGVLHGA
jgi:hypothetical protein